MRTRPGLVAQHALRGEILHLPINGLLGFPGQRPQAKQCLDHAGVELGGQEWQELVSQPVPRKSGIGVAGIGPIGLPHVGQVVQKLGPAESEQGADQRAARSKRPGTGNARKTVDARAAEDPMEDRLRLVVGRMGRDHVAGPAVGGELLEHLVTDRSGGRLQTISRLRHL